ncbi:alpha/beta hydrolase [Stenotrophomonas oahuensis]|uniref:Alpha/beta fold hydrolase n=1 Tax=Stenotrophomonas oahuensis TaxID=3003271 RepID=A0ABY9YKC6_9GAMM|nr:alpha/beta fold hydrolase [Stenotrophomonas sp. A5586]WNH51306.1 alpha/beta fold hydrolase [Stenotrophomonas sp. A5586]
MRTRLASLALLLASVTTSAHAASPEQTASQLLDHLQAGNMTAAEAMFTPDMAKAAPAAQLQTLWQQLGGLKSRGPVRVVEQQGMPTVLQPLQFGSGPFNAVITVDAQGRIAGLYFLPVQPAAPPPPPVPADAPYRESEVQIDSGKGALPGTLAMPVGKGPFPAVVLVHGSGPQDRNVTIGQNRPFLDVARGLAAQGIAVLRYEKRTKVRPQDFSGDFTVDDEITDDAVAALALLASTPGIDARHLYVIGHSQGGMIAPRIATRSGKVAGVVLWSAPARSLLDIMPEQHRYLFNLDGQISPQEKAVMDRLDAQIAAARGTEPVAPAALPLGLPAHYWRTLEQVDPVADAKALSQPILVLHGGRDFQVIDTDWKLWSQALSGTATLHRYDQLNHLGIAGEGPGSIEEYSRPGHVDKKLIDDVADWIRAQP